MNFSQSCMQVNLTSTCHVLSVLLACVNSWFIRPSGSGGLKEARRRLRRPRIFVFRLLRKQLHFQYCRLASSLNTLTHSWIELMVYFPNDPNVSLWILCTRRERHRARTPDLTVRALDTLSWTTLGVFNSVNVLCVLGTRCISTSTPGYHAWTVELIAKAKKHESLLKKLRRLHVTSM